MPSTKMFRDRVVSMEQTLEKGEKQLPLLKALVDEALPGMEFSEHLLDHEHDCFVMLYRMPNGSTKRISWTRMVLCDAERIPAIVEDPQAEIRGRLVEYLRKRGERGTIDVTFRHLEAGWVDTPEPRKPKPAPQRGKPQGGRGPQPGQGRGDASGGRAPQGQRQPQQQQQQQRQRGGGPNRPPQPNVPRPSGPRPSPAPPSVAGAPPAEGEAPAGGRRRRFRRRRGRRRGGPGSGPAAPPAGGGPPA